MNIPEPGAPEAPAPESAPNNQVNNPVVTPESSVQPGPAAAPPAPVKRSRRKLYISLVILILLVVGAAAWLLLKPDNKPAVVTKKDIPLIRFGSEASGEIPQYPLKYTTADIELFTTQQLFEGLVGYKNETQIVPLLAQSWNNPDNNTWVFNLRHDVKFHSGRTMTAQDVKFTLDYAISHRNDDDSAFSGFTAGIKSVTINNPYQVTITTDSPNATLLFNLGMLGIVDSKATLGDYNAGTGPYIVKPGTKPTSTSIDLAAANNYWQGHVYTREVRISLYSDDNNKMAKDAASGKLDLAGPLDENDLKTVNNFQTISIPDLGTSYIGINSNNPASPLHNLAARQAATYAMNIPEILKAAKIKGVPNNQIVPSSLAGHDPSIPNTSYNPEKARQLLSGVSNAKNQITFAHPTLDNLASKEMMRQLSAVGFNIKDVPIDDFNTFLNDTYGGKYDLFTLADTSASDGLPILSDILINVDYYHNPKVDSLIEDANSTLNTSSRIKDMQQIAQIVYNDKPVIPLYSHSRNYIYNNKNYVLNTDLADLSISNYFWKVYQR
jgi:peptide/nickel transport system substrate-binding protein